MKEHYKIAIDELRRRETWVNSDNEWASIIDSWAVSFIRSDDTKFTFDEWEALAFSDVAFSMNCLLSSALKCNVIGLTENDSKVCMDDLRVITGSESRNRRTTADSIHASRIKYISNVEKILDAFSAYSISNVKKALEGVESLIIDTTQDLYETD